jgi:excisionase family DNA binding protein
MKKGQGIEELPVSNLSVLAAAKALGIGLRKMHQLVYERKIEHVRIGSRVLIPVQAICEFNAQHTVKAADFSASFIR